MNIRLEILRDGEWRELNLGRQNAIKYNALVNRIGDISVREISHSNTFSIPYVAQNIQALELNLFNVRTLATSLNSKYEAKYFIQNRLFKKGFIVINNTKNGSIKLNFIDDALSLTESWSQVSYRDVLRDKFSNMPADYQSAITEMVDYDMIQNGIVPSLTAIGTRGYNLALFPNNLNTIGDNFQKLSNGTRGNDTFNPYQSRPVFNAKAFFETICYGYGYTPIFDQSISETRLEETFIVSSGLNEGAGASFSYSSVSGDDNLKIKVAPNGLRFDVTSVIAYPSIKSLTPAFIDGWVAPDSNFVLTNYESEFCVFVPDVSDNYYGQVTFTASEGGGANLEIGKCYGVWSVVGSTTVFKELTIIDPVEGGPSVSFSIDKAELETAPAGGETFRGIISYVTDINALTDVSSLSSMQVTETFLTYGEVSYDEDKQYSSELVDLTHAAPTDKVNKLLSGLMEKEGILLNINSLDKEVTFFGYGVYKRNRDNGNFYDWSEYLRKYTEIEFNTDYGKNYAQRNALGLSSPYPGNTAELQLTNSKSLSKYKEYSQNYIKTYKDVESVSFIAYPTSPYFEYKNTGLGLVEEFGTVGPFTQTRADGTTQGTIISVDALANVNYLFAPPAVQDWFYIVDNAVRATPTFLLPEPVLKNLDLTKPVYVEDLRGFYIIEEVEQYENSTTEVRVKLIKVVD